MNMFFGFQEEKIKPVQNLFLSHLHGPNRIWVVGLLNFSQKRMMPFSVALPSKSISFCFLIINFAVSEDGEFANSAHE